MPLPHVVARVNKRVTNRFIEPIARLSSGFAVVHHVGRRSGADYRTPVNVFGDGDDVLVALTYGPDADWFRNVLAGPAHLEQRRAIAPIRSVEVVGRVDAWPAIPRIVRGALRVLGVRDFARLRVGPRTSAGASIEHVSDEPTTAPAAISGTRPTSMGRWWLRNRWDNLAFLHWAYDPDVVQSLLPDDVRVDTFDGMAYVSLVPFEMNQATLRFVPPLPWLSSFIETNVRTYVVDSVGNRAVWFFTLEANRLPIVAFARFLLGFPYVWSEMSVEAHGTRRRYETTRRRWPGRPASTTTVSIDIGDAIDEPSPLDVFLTARWGTVVRWRGRLRHHPVDHPEWRIHEANPVEIDDASFVAAGLPTPTGEPIVRWVDGIDAWFGRPTRV